MSIIKSVRDFIKTCPLLNVDSTGKIKIGVDYLQDDVTSYSIEEVPNNPIVKKYIDGSSIRQATFLFCSKELYGPELQQQLNNSGFYEDFSNWIEENTNNKILPQLDTGKDPLSLEIISSGYIYANNSNNAVYQIQLRLTYFQGR